MIDEEHACVAYALGSWEYPRTLFKHAPEVSHREMLTSIRLLIEYCFFVELTPGAQTLARSDSFDRAHAFARTFVRI